VKIWDISQALRPETPVWPGEPPFEIERIATIDGQCPVNVGVMRTSLHTGTHADSPCHYDAAGLASAECDLSPYIGPCIVVDVRTAGELVTEEDVNWNALRNAERVLFRTYDSFPAEQWDSEFKAIAPNLVARLGRNGVRLIGVDTVSLDPQESKALDAHMAVRAADMRILEGLVLDGVPAGGYELIALPLKIAGGDASPVRAILRELP
tara:strand:- start:35399 stop:36025 length:627 start_codon:yes stop_codon:yes gene_type:complete